MKNKIILSLFLNFVTFLIKAQEAPIDSILTVDLEEVIVISREELNNQRQVKPLASVDDYLEKSQKVTMIKRGNYAWEPAMNNMSSERLKVTIDGMQIFGACTDKMDPITSYVDISNLSEVSLKSGQQGSEHGATIGGGIDLKLKKSEFEQEGWDMGLDSGFESNGAVKILSGAFNWSENKFYFNSDIIYRNSDNYFAGGGEEIEYSQYEKFNVSTSAGFKLTEKGSLLATLIYDKATDVGYPALPMDVSRATALISSVTYEIADFRDHIDNWETKLYFNSIEHVMDDTKRENVAIHMDMPGWSDTFGFYSKMNINKKKHQFLFNLNAYYNRSLAEMTMYPDNPDENLMFMLTWPDVRTMHSGLFVQDEFEIDASKSWKLTGRLAFQNENIADEFGLKSLQIFYPEMNASQNRMLMNLSAQYAIKVAHSTWSFSGGYGQRAPSVSEAYGFYLFNSYDNYDYIGNPYLNQEKSAELNLNYDYVLKGFKFGFDASYFYMFDYIIGEIDPSLSPMTIGAEGVKIYSELDYATIFNTGIQLSYDFYSNFTLAGSVAYNFGQDNENENLPMISPIQYNSSLKYQKGMFYVEVDMKGGTEQKNYAEKYGETPSNAYTVFDAIIGSSFYFGSQKLLAKAGIENIFDIYYSTYADWNRIPRRGRNMFLNISYVIK